MSGVISVRFQVAGHTAAEWAAISTVPLAREVCVETDTQKFKVGNGVDVYDDLPFASADAETLGGHPATYFEPAIAAGSAGQYWRFDKTWAALTGGVVANTPAGNIAATTVQGAINELDSEKIAATEKGAASGVATLDGSGKVPTSQLPALAITSTFVVNSQVAQLALTAQEGDVAVRTDQNKSYIHNGGTAGTMADWQEMLTPTDLVLSVNGMTGAVTVTTISGNAGSATVLQNSRNIDGQAFNGSTDITVIAPATHAATSKATPVDADELPLVDSAASNVLKKLTWANLKATLKTYFDTIYQAAAANLTTWAGIAPGSNVATFLATPSSANLAAALTDETGSGANVHATNPTFADTTNTGKYLSTAAAGAANFQANQTTGSIADNGTYDFAAQNYSLFFIVETQATAQAALCATDGGNVFIIWQSGALYTAVINTASHVNLYYSGGAPRIQNKRGGASTFSIINLKAVS